MSVDYLLQESGSKLNLEDPTGALLLESSSGTAVATMVTHDVGGWRTWKQEGVDTFALRPEGEPYRVKRR